MWVHVGVIALSLNMHGCIFAEFESRFQFHTVNEFPPPEPLEKHNKTYPSKAKRAPGKIS